MADPIEALLAARGVPPNVVAGGAAGLVGGWRAFVSEVEAGYPFGLDDYRNELDLRTLIGAVGLAEQVVAEDARFQRLLVKTDVELWSGDGPEAWWTRGYPGNSGPLLLEDLAAESLL